ncbi:MAG: T9SS type A sorting domain-containing protein [Bacteroidales bacterium]
MKKFLIVSAIIFSCFPLSAQQYLDYGFQRDLSVIVKDNLLNNLKNPWGGGLNSCQFSEIDLNQDGIKDLFVFDRSSSKILTFINNGAPNTIDYTFTPEYISKFPPIHDWAQLVDYNCDGKEDIFTYGIGGITVYKNISDTVNGLLFSLITTMIYSQQGPNYVNLLVTQVDYPAIADIDNDGDLDILTFFGLGSYIEFHQNMSKESYGNCDSLNYVLQDYCWGNFAENSGNNNITLNIICPPWKKSADKGDSLPALLSGTRHTGSTLLATDLNGDNVKDLLVGDVGYPGIIKLTNGGTADSANMISQDTLFPSDSTKVNIVSFPVPCFLDVNNDNKKDLIVSPFDPSLATTQNLKSCWYYKNNGSISNPIFDYQSDSFLQSDMIDVGGGAYPVLCDYDCDGLPDLFIGNFGKIDSTYYLYGNLIATYKSSITLYKNIGTANNPEFQFITNDFANLAHLKLNGIVPTFGDIDGDSATEMIIGKSDGKLDLYDNTAGPGNPMNMVLSQSNYMGINVGNFSTPQFVDIDGDSLLDLVIGEKKGNLNFYKNTGTKYNPVFTFVTDSFGHIDIIDHSMSNYGYSVPCFFKDSTNHLKLFVGSESGYIFYYKDIENNLNGNFTLEDTKLGFIYNGTRCGVAVGNLNNDNYPDLITGNFSGGVCYYKGVFPPPAGISEHPHSNFLNAELYPNPADDKVFIKFSNTISNENIDIKIYNAIGTCVFSFRESSKSVCSIDVSNLTNGLYICIVTTNDNTSGNGYPSLWDRKLFSKKLLIIHQ